MRSCDEIVNLLSAALDGALTSDEQSALNEHLTNCPACSALFADLSALHTASMELEDVTAPAGFAARVMDAIAADPIQEQANTMIPFPVKKHSHIPWKKLAASAAVVAVAALGAIALPGQFGGNTMDTADMAAAPAAAPESVIIAEAPAEAAADMGVVEDQTAAYDNSSASMQSFSLKPKNETSGNADAEPEFAAEEGGGISFQNVGTTAAKEILMVCGVLVLSEEALPEGIEAFTSIQNEDGTLIYSVPTDYFFSCAQVQTTTDYSLDFEVVTAPDAERGLIIVQPN